MLITRSLCVIWLLLGIVLEISSSDYLHFGGTEEESRQAEYYLSADSGTNIGPTEELKRTQRSFWRKLFKNGLFGECDNCCNNCNYNVGNGDNYNQAPPPLLPFQPWRQLPLLRPLQPLFGPVNYDNYAGGNSNNYENPPSNGINTYNGVNNPPSYDNNVPSSPEDVYETPSEMPPAESDYKPDNTPAKEATYEPVDKPDKNEKSYSAPEISSYTIAETPKYSSAKVPQIIYQPIIYVSPQYQGNKALNQVKDKGTIYSKEYKEDYKPSYENKALNQVKEEGTMYSKESKEDYKPNYETASDYETKQPSYSQDADETKSDYNENFAYKKSENETPAVETPCSKSSTLPYTDLPVTCLGHPSTNPAVSTVSTVYNIISPSLLHSLTAGQHPYASSLSADNLLCFNEDSYKIPLHSSNVIPLENYSAPPTSQTYEVPLTPPPSKQTYAQPIHLTSDDQPYRVCPELFDEYHRKLNKITPHMHGSSGGSTFVNAQLIHY